ncbi:hypothetical protein N7537_012148 [Penicillium hordei]|uniref:Uncharacterized protein n=1 Tax=Penicillium hordei TaxID=40994 RepID=A0AAD6GUT0_9EURO|nr:uncharacterized protein N7537_012148 [Penicillium hordei]KAJ5589470.1 hypothetical protein N7537_012148 [Penicillium hordei]
MMFLRASINESTTANPSLSPLTIFEVSESKLFKVQKHLIHPLSISECTPPKIDNRPDFDSILRRVLISYLNIEDPLRLTRIAYEEAMAVSGPDQWHTHALETKYYIKWHMTALQRGYPSLLSLGSLRNKWLESKRNDPPTCQRAFGLRWQIESLLDDSNEGSPTPIPHTIIETIAHVPANHADQSLTRHEALSEIYDPSILSYMGEQHGRIIQALFDGENLVLQHSQLWSFENEDIAPVELFIRYIISQLGWRDQTLVFEHLRNQLHRWT